jgi:hypothetical protein
VISVLLIILPDESTLSNEDSSIVLLDVFTGNS